MKQLKVKIDLKATKEQLSENETKGPLHISLYSSENRRYNAEVNSMVTWEKKTDFVADKKSDPVVLSLDLPVNMKQGAKIWATLWTYGENGPRLGGTSGVPMKRVLEKIKDKGTINTEIRYNQYEKTKLKKGNLTMEFKWEENKKISKNSSIIDPTEDMDIKFTDSGLGIEIVEENFPKINKVLNTSAERTYPYLKMKPIRKEIDGIETVKDEQNYPVPSRTFFLSKLNDLPDDISEKHFDVVMKVGLAHAGITEKEFISTINNELFSSDSNPNRPPSTSLVKCVRAFGLMSTRLAVSRKYKTDSTYVRGKLNSTEEFSILERMDRLRYSGNKVSWTSQGDCEDDARSIHETLTQLQNGNFTNELVVAAQKLSKLYIFCGTLTSCTQDNVQNAKGDSADMVIGDPAEDKLSIGAHMYVLGIPIYHFEKMVKEGRKPENAKELDFESLNTRKNIAMSKKVCHLVLEGTGDFDPLIFPHSSYVDQNSKEDIEEMKRYQSSIVTAKKMMSDCEYLLQYSDNTRIGEKIEYKPGRLSIFYRVSTTVFTGNTFKKKDKVETQNGHKFIIMSKDLKDNTFERGAYVVRLCLGSNLAADPSKEPLYKKTTLEMVPNGNEYENLVIKNLLEQTPFDCGRYINSETVSKRLKEEMLPRSKISRDQFLTIVNKELSGMVNKNKKISGNVSKKSTQKLFYSFKEDTFFTHVSKTNEYYSAHVLAGLKSLDKKLVGASVTFTPLTDYIHNIYLQVELDISDSEKQEFDSDKYDKDVEEIDKRLKEKVSEINTKKTGIKLSIDSELRSEKEDFHIESYHGTKRSALSKIAGHSGANDQKHIEYMNDYLKSLVNISNELYLKDNEIPKQVKMNPGGPSYKYYGYKTIVIILGLLLDDSDIVSFITTHKSRAIILPWISYKKTEAVNNLINSLSNDTERLKRVLKKIVLDHSFFYSFGRETLMANGMIYRKTLSPVTNGTAKYVAYNSVMDDSKSKFDIVGDWMSPMKLIKSDAYESGAIKNLFTKIPTTLSNNLSKRVMKDKKMGLTFFVVEFILLDTENIQ